MANTAVVLRVCYLAKIAVFLIFLLSPVIRIDAADFFCPSGDVTCLIATINQANGTPAEEHTISLEAGTYTLQTIDNGSGFQGNGLPVIRSSIQTRTSAEDLPTIIERDPNAPAFRIFSVAVGGELHLNGITVRRGGGSPGVTSSPAIENRGVTSLQESTVRDSDGEFFRGDRELRHVTRYQKYNR